MRHSKSELGYLAPARDFGHTASVVLVAGAVGATAAGGAVLALLGGPGSDSSLATPAVMRSVEPVVTRAAGPSSANRTRASSAAPAQTARANAASFAQEQVLPSSTAGGQPAAVNGELDSGSPEELPAAPERSVAAHDAAGKAAATPAGAPPAEAAAPEKKVNKKPAFFSRYAWRGGFFRDSGRWGGGGFYRDRGWRRDVW
jgi:hypothetical protein